MERKFLGLIFILIVFFILIFRLGEQRLIMADPKDFCEKYDAAKSIVDDETWQMLNSLSKDLDDMYSKYGGLFFTHPETGEIIPLIGDFNNELEEVISLSEDEILKKYTDPKKAQSLLKFKQAVIEGVEESVEDIYIRAFGKEVYDLALSFREKKLEYLLGLFRLYSNRGLYERLKNYGLDVQLLGTHTARPGYDVFIIDKCGSISLKNLLENKNILNLSEITGLGFNQIETFTARCKRLENLKKLRNPGGIAGFCACLLVPSILEAATGSPPPLTEEETIPPPITPPVEEDDEPIFPPPEEVD